MKNREILKELQEMKDQMGKMQQSLQVNGLRIYTLRRRVELETEKIYEISDQLMKQNQIKGKILSDQLEKIRILIDKIENH